MTKSLGIKLSELLFQEEPNLLACDLETSARAAAEVSNLLGCIMATLLAKSPGQYERAFRAVILNAHKSAQDTAGKAMKMDVNITTH